jgi:hypothetical protein
VIGFVLSVWQLCSLLNEKEMKTFLLSGGTGTWPPVAAVRI